MDGIVLGLFLLAAFMGGFASGVAGFAMGFVVSGIWLHIITPIQTTTLIAGYGLLTQGYGVWKLRHALTWRSIAPFIIGGTIGVPIGTWLLTYLNPAYLRSGVGLLLVIYGAYGLLQPALKPAPGTVSADTGIGFANGVLAGLTGLPGFIITVWCQLRGWTKDVQRAADEVLVLAAGIATVRKAPDLFLEIALAYRQRGAPPARFVWLGGERDPLFHLTIAEARRLGLDEVRMFHQVVDVTPWLAAADVFVHPARLDSFPLVCLHAAAAGTNVVAFSGVGGVVEMFADTFRGAPYPDIAGLAAEIHAVADPATRGDIADRQQRRVVEHFTADVGGPVVRQWLVDAAERHGSPQ